MESQMQVSKRKIICIAIIILIFIAEFTISNIQLTNSQKDIDSLSAKVAECESYAEQMDEKNAQLEKQVKDDKDIIKTQKSKISDLKEQLAEEKSKPKYYTSYSSSSSSSSKSTNTTAKSSSGKYSLPSINTSFKSFMSYRAITNTGSAAYKLQQRAYSDSNGLRKVGDDYCVAMGTYYSSTIGDRFKVTMSTGTTFTVIISDVKANAHTDANHQYTIANHCMMEFLVDMDCLASCVRTSGSVGSIEMFSGTFASIQKI